MPNIRVLIADGGMLLASLASVLLAACATSSEPAAPTVVRTRAPVAYEKTVNNYLAFKLRPQKNTRISVAPPEPGDCPIDGTPSSIRGWVVPVTHETFSGELTGKDTIRITDCLKRAKQEDPARATHFAAALYATRIPPLCDASEQFMET